MGVKALSLTSSIGKKNQLIFFGEKKKKPQTPSIKRLEQIGQDVYPLISTPTENLKSNVHVKYYG